VGRLRAALTDFLNDPQWISDFLEFWRFHVSVCPDLRCSAISADCGKLLRQFAEKKLRGELQIQPRYLESAELMVKSTCISAAGWRTKMGCSSLLNPYKLAGRRLLALIADSLAEALAHDSPDRLKNMRQYRFARGWFVDRTKGRVRRWCVATLPAENRDRVRRFARGAIKVKWGNSFS